MAVGREAEPVAADDGRLFFGGQELDARHAHVDEGRLGPDPLRRHPEDVPARHVDAAREAHEDEERPARLEAVDAHVDPVAPLDARGLRGGKGPRRVADGGCLDAGDGLCPLGRERLDMGGQAVEAETVFFYELVVIEFFGDDDVDHGQGKGAFASGPELEPVIGDLRRADTPRVHDDHLLGHLERPVEHAPAHAVGRPRLRVVAAPVHDAGRRRAAEAVDVDDGEAAEGEIARDYPREVAKVAGAHEIGRAEGVGEPERKLRVGPPRALGHGKILGPRLPADPVEALNHPGDRLIPRDPLPPVLAAVLLPCAEGASGGPCGRAFRGPPPPWGRGNPCWSGCPGRP